MKSFMSIVCLVAFVFLPISSGAQSVIQSVSGKVSFVSTAPLEIIRSESKNLNAVIDPVNRKMAYSVRISSFEGFNSPLQREHFNENYMETSEFPTANFTGKLIENIDFDIPGAFDVRAKGLLTIHGISNERIVKGEMIISQEKIILKSQFSVQLEDHQILVPSIVNQKIAEEIMISLEIIFQK